MPPPYRAQVGQPLALQAARAELDPYQAQEREYEELLCLSSKKTGQKCTEVRGGARIHVHSMLGSAHLACSRMLTRPSRAHAAARRTSFWRSRRCA